jgi:hypothetical protein
MKVTVKNAKTTIYRKQHLYGSVHDPGNAREINALCAFDGEGNNLGHFVTRAHKVIKEGDEVTINDNWADMTDATRRARLDIYGGITVECPTCKREL